jgi:hypothetical protein
MTRRKKIGLVGATGVALVGRLAVVAAVILGPGGAGAEEARSSVEAPAPSGAARPQLPRQDFPEPVLGSLRTALGAYEEVRGELAADRLEGVPASASRLAGALRLALDSRAGLAGQISGVIEEAALIAKSMAEAEDLAAARAAFGEVSRLLLLLASCDPRLAEGRHVFACPMAKTFGKWIQPTEALENPYMGPAMPACGSPVDWSVPAFSSTEEVRASAQEAGLPGAQGASGAEPEFRPGISGLKMVDVRDHKFLWREIEELQIWERGDRISIAEYRSKVIEKTVHFLGLSGAAADEFAAAASVATASIRESFFQRRRAGGDPGGVQAQFSSDLRAAATRVTSLLQKEPRHQLFAPECKKWLLKLAFGPSEAKEAREA